MSPLKDRQMSRVLRPIKNQSGSAIVEGAIVSGAFSLIVGGCLISLYFVFSRVWLERSAYEATVCLASTQTKATCERELRLQIDQALPIGELTRIQMTKSSSLSRVTLKFSILEPFILKEDVMLRLPIRSSAQASKVYR